MKLDENHKITFSKQIIDYYNPGSVLKDFETLLEFIDYKSIKVTEKNNILPLKVLPELNSMMTTPDETNLKRPQQKNYPHINALWFLLRFTGLGYIIEDQYHPLYVIDKKSIDLWKSINKTERYFYLLSSWICRENIDAFSDRIGIKYYIFYKSIFFYVKFLKEKFNKNEPIDNNDFFYIAMMELFGIVSVRNASFLPGKGWCAEEITVTEFGFAFIDSLSQIIGITSEYPSYFDIENKNIEKSFTDWCSLVYPCFSEFEKLMKIPERGFLPDTHIFKISMDKNIWRRVAIPGTILLEDLSNLILDAFNFFDTLHLYRYSYENRYGNTIKIDHPELLSENLTTDKVRLGDIPLFSGMNIWFLFDFGEQWYFKLHLEKITSKDIKTDKAINIEKHGVAPEQYE